MPVVRKDLNLCIGCETCFNVCPMDVFRIDSEAMKSVIAFPENCQTCGQCYMCCPSDSISIAPYSHGYVLTSSR